MGSVRCPFLYISIMALSEEVEYLSRIVRENAIKYCVVAVRYYKFVDKLSYKEARERYLQTMTESEDYAFLQRQLNGVIKDIEKHYKMERWWAESYLGLNLEKIVLDGFEAAWKDTDAN